MFQVGDAACPAAATLAAAHDQRHGDRKVAPAEPTGSRARAWPMICPRAARLANQPPKGLYVNTADSWESAAFFSIDISWLGHGLRHRLRAPSDRAPGPAPALVPAHEGTLDRRDAHAQ